jgi:hypothetical protein
VVYLRAGICPEALEPASSPSTESSYDGSLGSLGSWSALSSTYCRASAATRRATGPLISRRIASCAMWRATMSESWPESLPAPMLPSWASRLSGTSAGPSSSYTGSLAATGRARGPRGAAAGLNLRTGFARVPPAAASFAGGAAVTGGAGSATTNFDERRSPSGGEGCGDGFAAARPPRARIPACSRAGAPPNFFFQML